MPLLKIEFSNQTGLAEAMQTKSSRVLQVLSTKLTALMFMLEGKAKEKLSGQVLRVRSGILRSSVHANPTEVTGTTIRGSVQAGGGPSTLYGTVHELGGSRVYEILIVKKRALAFVMNAKQVYAHSVMHPPLRQRAFMQPSLDESADQIRAALEESLRKAIEEK